jgi:UDP-3-O-acyl-N-acetylglucosamine deacetylase
MDRTELSRPVRVTGPSFLGRETSCTLEPADGPGIFVTLPTGESVALSDMTLGVNRALRFLTLRRGKSVLRIPEHLLGLLFSLGLDGIRIVPQAFRLPYDGRAAMFWAAIRPALRRAGKLDWLTVPAPLTVAAAPGRSIAILPAAPGCRRFAFDINVGYPDLGEATLSGIAGADGQSGRLATARPYLRNRGIRACAALAGLCGWPHGAFAVALASDGDAAKKALLDELCWHRLLDMLGSFMAVCPPGGRIAGSIVTRRVGHATDIALMQQIRAAGLVRV